MFLTENNLSCIYQCKIQSPNFLCLNFLLNSLKCSSKLFITFVVNLIITEKPARFFIVLFQVALQSVIRRGHFKKCNAHGRRHFLVFFSFLKAHCHFFHDTWWVSVEYPSGTTGKKEKHLKPMAVFILCRALKSRLRRICHVRPLFQ